jgi:hypothetical protein
LFLPVPAKKSSQADFFAVLGDDAVFIFPHFFKG